MHGMDMQKSLLQNKWSDEVGFLELAADRYSVRSFSDRAIEKEKMEKILKAGQLAPTAVSFQPQRIYVLKSTEAVAKIRSLTHFAYNAPEQTIALSDILGGALTKGDKLILINGEKLLQCLLYYNQESRDIGCKKY